MMRHFLKDWLIKLNIRPSKFTIHVKKWRDNSFQETKGKQEQLEIKQKIYDTWIKNTINYTNGIMVVTLYK